MSAVTLDATAPGWCCVDCLMLLANAETPPELSEDETAAWLAAIEARDHGGLVTVGRVFGHDGCEHSAESWHGDPDAAEAHAEGCEHDPFSWRPCDVCGSSLGGSRHAVTFWPPGD